jgi:hypothetical protein
MLINVLMQSRRIRSGLTHLQSEKYLMSMCRVRGVGFCAFPIAVQPSLSSYRRVAVSCGMFRSQRMLQTKRIILPVSQAAINSALVEEPAPVG